MSARRCVSVIAVLFTAGCASSTSPPRTSAHVDDDTSEGSSCAALGSLVDLRRALVSSPMVPSSPLYGLVDSEEELGHARVARAELKASHAAGPVRASVEALVARLEARKKEIARATERVRDSYAAAESALKKASSCRGIDLRETAKHHEKAQDLAIARSAECSATLRMWAVTKRIDLASDVSTGGVASQLEELRLDKEGAQTRDRLAFALTEHATRVAALKHTTGADARVADDDDLSKARRDLAEHVEDTYRMCLGRLPATANAARRVPHGGGDARNATVMVRPTWSGRLKSLGAGPTTFGSGFLVRWPKPGGPTETLVITNRHVMDGAVEAEVLFSSEIEDRELRKKQRLREARLVFSDENDDIAVLRVEGGRPLPSTPGLAFRHEPPSEQEAVIAAGFPGVGSIASFQVTKGFVSNAHFGSEERDVGIAYLQHTAPIDPGNSGGPLLDAEGRLLGMNTAKLYGRENVSLAIPGARIRFALSRVEQRRRLDVAHAEASCNVVLDALAAEHPTMASIGRFGLALFERSGNPAQGTVVGSDIRAQVVGPVDGPVDIARLQAFETAKLDVDQKGGIAPFEVCRDVEPTKGAPNATTFTASFTTRNGARYRVQLDEESGVVRVTGLDRGT